MNQPKEGRLQCCVMLITHSLDLQPDGFMIPLSDGSTTQNIMSVGAEAQGN